MYQKTTLNNGLRLITATIPHTRSVSICIFIGTGSRYETDVQAGISHFIEHLCFRGTPKRPTASDISTAIEGLGGILNGGTDKELSVYWCKVARPHFHPALEVLTDMILNPKFDPADIEKERQVIIEEINMSNDAPPQRVAILIDELLWPRHPLGRDIAGSKKSVGTLSRDTMLGYLASQYQPSNTVISIAGDIRHQEIVTAVKRHLEHWTDRQPRYNYSAYVERPVRQRHIETRDTEQVHLCLALPGLSLVHPGRFPLDLLNVVLGEGMSSRLFTEVRDKLGLVYSIGSFTDHLMDTGALTIAAGVEPKNLRTAIQAILEQLSRLKERIPESELTKAKEFAKGHLLLRMEDSRSVAGWLGGQELLTERILNIDEVLSITDAITAEELTLLAQELLVSDRLCLAIVGPVPSDEPLEELLKL